MRLLPERYAIGLSVVLGVFAASVSAYRWPSGPLLVIWVSLAFALGLWVSLTPAFRGLRERAQWLLVMNAGFVFFGLVSTQVAARRSTSATHLRYEGILLESVASFDVGSTDSTADVQLTPSPSRIGWVLRIARRPDSMWTVTPLSGIERLEVSADAAAPVSDNENTSAIGSAIVSRDRPAINILGPNGAIVDSLRWTSERDGPVLQAHGTQFRLTPVNMALASSYRRDLRVGTTLSRLDRSGLGGALYERYVRVQVPRGNPAEAVLTAAQPFSLETREDRPAVAFRDSANVEVHQGGTRWTFQLVRWRRTRSADPGMMLRFIRNPRPTEFALPAGVNCPRTVACGVLSLRRLPAPIPHIALDNAGFASNRVGLLATIQPRDNGLAILQPRSTDSLVLGSSRPTAIALRTLPDTDAVLRAGQSHHWVLLRAVGVFSDKLSSIVWIGLGIALILAGMHGAVRSVHFGKPAGAALNDRALSVGIVAILGLLLVRLVIGARVTFFAPFADRGIQTAVGIWVATAFVSIGLLSWSNWVPQLLTAAHQFMNGRGISLHAGRRENSDRTQWSPLMLSALVALGGIGFLAIANWQAVWRGAAVGGMILLSWITVAWILAFSGDFFETFGRGAWSLVEQLAPAFPDRNERDSSARSGGRWPNARRFFAGIPELPLILTCLSAEIALQVRLAAIVVAATIVIATVWQVIKRRHGQLRRSVRDYWATAFGAAIFIILLVSMTRFSENGAGAAFVMVVFVSLASVRIGRVIRERIAAQASVSDVTRRIASSQPSTRLSSWRHSMVTPFVLGAVLLLPLLLLSPLIVIDMGLFLVVVLPIGFAAMMAAGIRDLRGALVLPAIVVTLFGILFARVLFPSVTAVRDADSHVAQSVAFEHMATFFGWRPAIPAVAVSLDRVASRALATEDPSLAEQVLVSAKPGPARDLLAPAIEQIWGAQAYAHSGWRGVGLGNAVIGGRGIAEAVSYAENAFSVYVLAEHGALGGMMILLLYLTLIVSAAVASLDSTVAASASHRASRALFLVATLLLVVPAVYVALSNVGIVPITGQNMPFLGLNAWSDVALCAGSLGVIITGALRRAQATV